VQGHAGRVCGRGFAVGIFPLRHLFGLTGNRPQSLAGYTAKRYHHFKNQNH